MKNGQSVRRLIIFIFFLLFPIILNYMSPYVIIDGAIQGILAGDAFMFGALFLSSIFLGRAWCGWICPGAGLGECSQMIVNRPDSNKTNWIKWVIFIPWLGAILWLFWRVGGIHSIVPLHLTENIISVDKPVKYIIYYSVITSIFIVNLVFGRRAFCHKLCWMAPFLIVGQFISNKLKLPSLKLSASAEACTQCKLCTKHCQMSLPVHEMVIKENMYNSECILCGMCVDHCPHKVIRFKL